jgi:hypothetical protein
MTNHPNRAKSYWLSHPRRFANEYAIGVATTAADAEQYEAEDYRRIDRDVALHMLSRRPGDGETLYASATVDGIDVNDLGSDRFILARQIRRGEI